MDQINIKKAMLRLLFLTSKIRLEKLKIRKNRARKNLMILEEVRKAKNRLSIDWQLNQERRNNSIRFYKRS